MNTIKLRTNQHSRYARQFAVSALATFLVAAPFGFHATRAAPPAAAPGNCSNDADTGSCSPSQTPKKNLNPKGCDAQTDKIDCYNISPFTAKSGTVDSIHCGAVNGPVLSSVDVNDNHDCSNAGGPGDCCNVLMKQPCIVNHYSHNCNTSTAIKQCHQAAPSTSTTTTVSVCQDTNDVEDKIVSDGATSTTSKGCGSTKK